MDLTFSRLEGVPFGSAAALCSSRVSGRRGRRRAVGRSRRDTPTADNVRPVDPSALRAELAEIRRRGFSSASGEREPGIAGVAAAVPLARTLHAAVQVAGYLEDLPLDRVAALGVELRRAALAIGRTMPGGG